MTKKILTFSLLTLIVLLGVRVFAVSAQETNKNCVGGFCGSGSSGRFGGENDYTPLEKLPGITVKSGSKDIVDFKNYLPNVIRLAIGIAIALSVIYLIIGGFKYLSTDAIFEKKEGKETIQNALLGLFLAISSVVILNTINPNITSVNLDIHPNEKIVAPINLSNIPDNTPWVDDSKNRSKLAGYNTITPIQINNYNCTYVGQTGCTSLTGMPDKVIISVGELSRKCNCSIMVTGGTEFWLHSENTQHRPGGNVIDLRLGGELDNFLRKNGKKDTSTSCTSGSERYIYKNGLYVNEQIEGNVPHWHVCYQ